MMVRLLALCLSVLVLLGAPLARAEDAEVAARHKRIVDLLFPQAAAWTPLSALPNPKSGSLSDIMPEHLWSATKQDFGNENCSTPLRLFTRPNVESLFRLVDLGDGADSALIYSDQAYCSEGSLTFVWQNFELPARFRGGIQATYYRPRLLRVRQGADAQYVGVEEGCCADPFDVYAIGSLFGRRYEQQVRVFSEVALIEGAVEKRVERQFDREITLRIGPETLDEYDEDASRYHGSATFGNIMRRYRPGVTARQVLSYRDPAGKVWGLYVVGSDNDHLSTHEPIGANLGWIAD